MCYSSTWDQIGLNFIVNWKKWSPVTSPSSWPPALQCVRWIECKICRQIATCTTVLLYYPLNTRLLADCWGMSTNVTGILRCITAGYCKGKYQNCWTHVFNFMEHRWWLYVGCILLWLLAVRGQEPVRDGGGQCQSKPTMLLSSGHSCCRCPPPPPPQQ